MDDLHAIAHAYNSIRRTGALDNPAWLAAVAKYRERHPEASTREVHVQTTRLISDAAIFLPEITWDGVGTGPIKRYKPGAYIWE